MPRYSKNGNGPSGGGMTGGCTLDIEHMNMLAAINQRSNSIALLKKEMDDIKASIDGIQSTGKTMSDDDYEDLKMQSYRMQQLQIKMDGLTKNGNILEYYQRTGDILFQYYDIVDNGGAGCQVRPPPPNQAAAPSSILKYFESTNGVQKPPVHTKPPVHKKQNQTMGDDRVTLVEKYATQVGSRVASSNTEQACRHCGNPDQSLQPQEGVLICDKCNTIEYVLIDHDKPSYKDPPKEAAFAYKRINHLNEWLNQIQGKETTEIPDDVYDGILLEIKKRKITNMADLNIKRIKDILKKLRLNKYYEHCPHIINRLNGVPMPTLPSELEEKLRQMFCQIQVPFLKHMPPSRKNFLSYSYVLNKMMQLLEEDQYLSSFPLLKSREKLHQQDMIWRNICADLGWDFIPSL